MAALLEAEGLTAGYGQTAVLHGIDFAVEERGVTALLGANGAGKTTTLRDRKSTRLNSSHSGESRMPSSA